MQDLNNISINFDQNQVIILNLCLGIRTLWSSSGSQNI